MKKMYKIILTGAFVFATLAMFGWINMNSLENNANCTVYSEDEYKEKTNFLNGVIVTEPINPAPVHFTFDIGFKVPNDAIFQIEAGTSPNPKIIEDNYEYAIEYRGPFSKEINVFLSRESANQNSISTGVSFLMLIPSKFATCRWSAEDGIEITDFSRKHHFHFELLNHRFIDGEKLPSAYRVTEIN